MLESKSGNVDPANNDGPVPPAKGGEGGTPDVTGQGQKPAGTALDQETIDRFVDKGMRAERKKLHAKIREEYGSDLEAILEEWRESKDSVNQVAEKGAELTKLQREHARALKELETLKPAIAERESKLREYQIQQPVREAVLKVSPKTPALQKLLEKEVMGRVKLDDDGELTVLGSDGKELHGVSVDDLVGQMVNGEFADLVNKTRVGTGTQISRGTATSSPNGNPTKEERIAALRFAFASRPGVIPGT